MAVYNITFSPTGGVQKKPQMHLQTDTKRCIAFMRCIAVCPRKHAVSAKLLLPHPPDAVFFHISNYLFILSAFVN